MIERPKISKPVSEPAPQDGQEPTPAVAAAAADTGVDVSSPPKSEPAKGALNAKKTLKLLDLDIDKLIRTANPAQRAKLLRALNAKGISTGPKPTPDGGVLVEIKISCDLIEQIKEWALQAGTTFEEQVQMLVDTFLPSCLFGQWGGTAQPEPVAAAPAAPAAPAGGGAAAVPPATPAAPAA